MSSGWKQQYFRYRNLFLNIYNLYRKRNDVKTFFEVILTLSTTSIFLVFALKPTILTIIDLTKEIKSKEETITKMDTKIQNLKKAQNLLVQEQNRIQLLESSVPNNPAPVEFSRQIEGAAYLSSTKIQNLSLSKATLSGEQKAKISKSEAENFPQDASPLSFSTSFTGNYDSLIKLISDLEKMRRPIKFDNLTLAKNKSKTEGSDEVGLVITGRIPYFLSK